MNAMSVNMFVMLAKPANRTVERQKQRQNLVQLVEAPS